MIIPLLVLLITRSVTAQTLQLDLCVWDTATSKLLHASLSASQMQGMEPSPQ